MWRFALALAVSLVACDDKDNKDKVRDTDPPDPTGTDDGLVEDVFVQELLSPIDILWVVDPGWDEGMDALDEALDEGYETLLVADPSWQIGVLDATVDPGTPQFGLIGAKYTTWPPPPSAFSLGVADGPPRVRDSLYAALELRREHNANVEFLRSDAHLYVLVFTNVQDESADAEITRADWQAWFDALQPSESKRLGAIVDEDVRAYWDKQVMGEATVFVAGNFRKAVQTQLREAIGQKTEFVLSQVPTAPIAEVSVVYRERKQIFVEPEFSFSTSKNSVIFEDYVPPPDSEIHVVYEGVPIDGEPTEPATPPVEE